MGKIVVKIVTPSINNHAGGLADYNMLRPYKADVVLNTTQTEAKTSGGVLPITQAEYDRVVA